MFNKADLAPLAAKQLVDDHPGSVAISAVTGDGLDDLLGVLADRLRALTTVVELAVPYDRGDVLAAIHREGEVVSTTDDPAAMRVRARLSGPSAGRLSEFVVDRRSRMRRERQRAVISDGPASSPAVPVRAARRPADDRRRPAGWRRRPVDRHADRPAADGRRVARCRRRAASAGYPPSLGSAELRRAIVDWIGRRFDVAVERRPGRGVRRHQGVRRHPAAVAAAAPPDRDTVLYPAVAYPTYEMGAILAGCRPVAVPLTADGRLDLDADRRVRRRPGAGAVGQLAGQSDRRLRRPRRGRRLGPAPTTCRCSPTSATSSSRGAARRDRSSQHGTDGVVAVHSLSKRSNLAGVRVGFYAGDPELVDYLQQVRKHVGMMVPGPAQAAGVVALDDDDHVAEQRERYRRRLERMREILGALDRTSTSRRRPGLLPLVRRRRRLGVRRAAGARGRRGRQPGRVLRRRERPVRPRRRRPTRRSHRARRPQRLGRRRVTTRAGSATEPAHAR